MLNGLDDVVAAETVLSDVDGAEMRLDKATDKLFPSA